MYKLNRIFLPLLMFFSISMSQNIWGGSSVSTSDNLDAFELNPAGLGIDRCSQSGLFLSHFNSGDSLLFSTAFRSDGLGYNYSYSKIQGHQYGFGFGAKLNRHSYFGLKWSNNKTLDLGFLLRPVNQISFGVSYNTPHDLHFDSASSSGRFGFSLRPFKQLITLGADMIIDDFSNFSTDKVLPFVEFRIPSGILLSLGMDDNENFNLNLSLNFGKEGVIASANSGDFSGNSGIGFFEYGQKQKTILQKPRDGKKYIRMKLDGLFIEEKPLFSPFDFNFNPFGGPQKKGQQLRKWIEEIDLIAEDESIDGIIIDLGHVSAGFGKRQEMMDALNSVKNSGKQIIVYNDGSISNMDYYLISMADEIYLPELGSIDLRGLYIEVAFLKSLLDTLDIVAEFEQISPYKTAADQFLRENMSDEMRENYTMLFSDIYDIFISGISNGRGWDMEKTKDIINNGPYEGSELLSNELITDYMYPDDFEDYINGLSDEVEIINWKEFDRSDDYVMDWVPEEIPNIAVIYAVGGIVSGRSTPGPAGSRQMGDKTIKTAIKSAREDESIDAIVLRINSGGGSALASDMMWKEVYNTTDLDTANGKPFIASMSDVAASGGYYIACQADTIVADPATITGSIGVLGGRLNFSGLFNKFGVDFDRLKFGKNSDMWSGGRHWTNDERARLREMIVSIYGTFLNRVAHGRESLDSLAVHEVGIGKVWSGKRAKELNLIDETGGLKKAIEIAKSAAGIPIDKIVNIVEYPKRKHGFSFKYNGDGFSIKNVAIDELSEELPLLDIIPILENSTVHFLMPYQINIK